MSGDNYSSRDGDGRGDRARSSREHYSSRSGREEHRDRGDRGERDRRRRSRSPGHRGSRRDYEQDSYSSSRNYREREREDRHRDGRHEDREWNRDRGPPRGGRDRDAGDRPPRRDREQRDLFDNNRRGRRDDRGGPPGGDAFQRQKSSSPPPKKREPTPDLTDVVPILERQRRMTQWDIKPPGYENVTAEQAKLSGMFPLPGAPRQQPMDPSRLQALQNQPAGSSNNTALKTSTARQSKRLFIYNIPEAATDESISDFFNLQLNGLNVISGPDPCLSAQMAPDRSFALLEFKKPEDATVAMAMDGISMEPDTEMSNGESNGAAQGFSIRRPKDYIVPTSADEREDRPGEISDFVPDTPHKISISNVPPYLTDEQVTELLTAFGDLRAFILVKDRDTEQSRGIAFCEYSDPGATDVAVEGLNGMELGDQSLKVVRASIGVIQASGLESGVNAMSMLAGTTSADVEKGRVLQLLNMVTPEELMDNDEYEEICEDIKEECSKFGKIEGMKVPRPGGGSRQSSGVGKIFLKYDTPESAQKALKSLAGRKFADRTVVVTFFGEEYFDIEAW